MTSKYSALLRATKTEAFALHVVETGCDACAATCKERVLEHIAFPQDQTLKAAARSAHAQKCAHCGIRLRYALLRIRPAAATTTQAWERVCLLCD